jgi:hypothetical protein
MFDLAGHHLVPAVTRLTGAGPDHAPPRFCIADKINI